MRAVKKADICVLIFAISFPSCLTWAYFVALADRASAVQQLTFLFGKVIQFAFPLVWVFVVLRERPRWPPPGRRGMAAAVGFGLLVLVGMFVLYHGVLDSTGLLVGLGDRVRDKIKQLGLDALWKYAAVGVFYSICHSLLEEYYWRWFVFGRLRRVVPFAAAALASSLGFMLHHVILLGTYFGWSSAAAWLFSLAVAAGGAAWAWIYERSESLYAPWLSHLLVDAGVFLIGFDLAKDLLV